MKIEYVDTPNLSKRDGHKVDAIVLHATLGAYEGAIQWLTMSPEEREKRTGTKSYSSAHFVIGRLGEITQLARLEYGTWHAGRISQPTDLGKKILKKKKLGGYINPNKHTIGIEFAAGYDIDRDGVLEGWEKAYTPQQIKACIQLVNEVIEPEIGIQFGEHNIITHRDVTAGKPDLDMQRALIVAGLKEKIVEPEKKKPRAKGTE